MTMFLNSEELEAGLENILQSPKNNGVLELIVRRPQINEREVLIEGELDLQRGLVGDNWKIRGSSRTTDGFGHPEMQLNLMNSRVAALVAEGKERWKLAGDQLFIDFDLSLENLPPGTKISIGAAVIEVSEIPHTGCKKFADRFGLDAIKFINSEFGRRNGFRGINAKVIQSGQVRIGDLVIKIS
jgi:hypothetical protein